MRIATCRLLCLSCLAFLAVASCGGGGGGGGSSFTIVEASNGFGKLLPYQVGELDALGVPTGQVIEITRFDQLLTNVRRTNPVKPPTEWPLGALLPNSLAGNHFIYVNFGQALAVGSVLSSSSAPGEVNNLTEGIELLRVDPVNGAVEPLPGRGFVGGQTFGPTPDPVDPSQLLLETWVVAGSSGLSATTIDGSQPGLGFPGTEGSFAGDGILIEPATFVFVVDSDGDLETHETFPTGFQIQMRITRSVRSISGRPLEVQGLASSTVGADTITPEVLVAGASQSPMIIPGNGQIDVDPQTNIEVQFTEPIQVLTLGNLDDGTTPPLSAAIQINFGPSAAKVSVPFHVRPFSVFDLSRFELVPVYSFPGTGPPIPGVDCGGFGTVDVVVQPGQFQDLLANLNALSPSTFFSTREGPGLVNAPVTPDTVYIGRTGSNQGISVIDLNGFGGGTGNPAYGGVLNPIEEGNSNYPNNPNVALQGSMLIPPLTPGTCTFNGGSAGVFTLARDSSLGDFLAASPLIESVGDMALGPSLDNTFNNEQPFGCQAGGGNICAATGLKNIALIAGGANTVASANIANLPVIKADQGVQNLTSWGPHPNPPPLTFPPLCLSPLINGLEPTSFRTTLPPPLGPFLRNLLVPGPFPQGIPEAEIPPQGLLTKEQNSFFEGPDVPQPNISACVPYMMRQQVGQFLYVVDRVAAEIVVFNSNRFTVLDRIRLPDPTSLAMSPNLDFLAVTNEGADQVSFIDVDPGSATFHQLVKTTRVGAGPTGIAWESSNEDIFVCSQGEGTVSLISGFTLEVRTVLRNQISRPIDVAITPRQFNFGFSRGVYFAYVLNQNGKVAFFESGPNGLNGWGFDDIIGSLSFTFFRPKTIQPDVTNLNSAAWIVHENPLDENGNFTGQTGGAISNVGIAGGAIGIIPLGTSIFLSPQIRELEFNVFASIGEGPGGLSGIPVDIAFDNLRNITALTNYGTQFSAGLPLSYNGKGLVKLLGVPLQTSAPQFMFAAVPNPGVIDVYDVSSGSFDRVDTNAFEPETQSIPAPNATVLMDYLRQ